MLCWLCSFQLKYGTICALEKSVCLYPLSKHRRRQKKKAMLRVCPTKIGLKNEDLEEYQQAKQTWTCNTNTQSNQQPTRPMETSAAVHRQAVRTRIGAAK